MGVVAPEEKKMHGTTVKISKWLIRECVKERGGRRIEAGKTEYLKIESKLKGPLLG